MWLERYYNIVFSILFVPLMMASKLKTPCDFKHVYRYIVSNKDNNEALATMLIPSAATYLFNLVYKTLIAFQNNPRP